MNHAAELSPLHEIRSWQGKKKRAHLHWWCHARDTACYFISIKLDILRVPTTCSTAVYWGSRSESAQTRSAHVFIPENIPDCSAWQPLTLGSLWYKYVCFDSRFCCISSLYYKTTHQPIIFCLSYRRLLGWGGVGGLVQKLIWADNEWEVGNTLDRSLVHHSFHAERLATICAFLLNLVTKWSLCPQSARRGNRNSSAAVLCMLLSTTVVFFFFKTVAPLVLAVSNICALAFILLLSHSQHSGLVLRHKFVFLWDNQKTCYYQSHALERLTYCEIPARSQRDVNITSSSYQHRIPKLSVEHLNLIICISQTSYRECLLYIKCY